MMPGISRNWRRTSTMIAWAVVPTARMASELKKKTSIAPIRAATKTLTSARLTDSSSVPAARVPASIWLPRIRLTLSM